MLLFNQITVFFSNNSCCEFFFFFPERIARKQMENIFFKLKFVFYQTFNDNIIKKKIQLVLGYIDFYRIYSFPV